VKAARLSNDSQASGLSFATAVAYPSGGFGANAVAIADVNGDGKPDLVLTNWCADNTCTGSNVGVLLGNGDGTFQSAVVYPSGGLYADSVVVADVNGDGKPDLIVANCGSNNNTNCVSVSNSGNVGVLIGNGDGTFQPVVNYALGGYGATSVAVADLRGDGKLDLLAAGACAGGDCVGVLLGNGDGTFQPVVTYDSGGFSALALAVGDVNGDSKPDLVVANCGSSSNCGGTGNVGVLLGNGDGTFQTAVAYGPGGILPQSVAIADVNGDGKPDLLVANSSTSPTVGEGNVGVLLGNGDGTFQTAVPYASGAFGASGVAVADVNGDGKPDLVVTNCSSSSGSCAPAGGNVGVLLGNGDGTFQTAVTYSGGGNAPFGVAVADVNGDGKPDVAAANCISGICAAGTGIAGVLINTSTSVGQTTTALTSSPNPSNLGQAVTLTATVTSQAFDGRPTGTANFYDGTTKIGNSNLNSSGVAILMTSTLTAGTHSLTASYSGDASFAPSTSSVLHQIVQAVSTTTLTISPSTVTFGSSVTLTAKVSSAVGTPPDGEIVTFKDATGTLGTGALSKGTAVFTSTTIPADTYAVVASYPGDADFLPSTSTPQVLNVQDFKLSANPTTVSVSAPGGGGSTTITITPYGNLKAQSVSNWTCTGLPSESNCSFGAVGSNDQVSLSITTTAASDLHWPQVGHHQRLFYAILLPGFLGMVSMAGHKRTLRRLRLLALLVVLGLPALWLACGGSSGTATNHGTPPGNSTVTVSATSGTLQRSTTITLAVQ
jgi:hypothetical protein